MSELSITPSPNLDNLQRREIARNEMAQVEGLGKFMYLLHSPYVRKGVLPDKRIAHSAIDLVNILSDTDNEPRIYWANAKSRILKYDKHMFEKIKHIELPLWNDKSGRYRATDALTTAGMVIVIFDLHTDTSNEVRHYIAEMYDRYPSEHHDQILYELEREVGWAGTRIRLEMKAIYEEGDYDNAIQPPGCPE